MIIIYYDHDDIMIRKRFEVGDDDNDNYPVESLSLTALTDEYHHYHHHYYKKNCNNHMDIYIYTEFNSKCMRINSMNSAVEN